MNLPRRPRTEYHFHASAQGSDSLYVLQQYRKLSCTLSDFAYAHNYDTGLYAINFQNQDLN